MGQTLSFEKPLKELRSKITELKDAAQSAEIDFSEEIIHLEQKFNGLATTIYANLEPWDRVQLARLQERPTTLDYVNYLFDDFIEFHGDRYYGDDEAIVGGIASFNGEPVTVIGHQRGKATKENIRRNFGMPHPEGYRKALRLMKQANKFKRPIICFIDTKGAYPGKAAEERGQSEAIAKNLIEMAGLTVPVISIVIGEGGSGGALGLGVANHVHMLENATYSVISPEGAASILWKDATLAKEAAEAMKITAMHLKEHHIIEEIIPEVLGGAHKNIEEQSNYIRTVLEASLATLQNYTSEQIIDQRYKKFRKMGEYVE